MGISQVVEEASSQSLLPSDLPLPERVKQWIALFFAFEKPDIKEFEEVLNQKKRSSFVNVDMWHFQGQGRILYISYWY